MNYVEHSIGKIKERFDKGEPSVIRFKATSGSPELIFITYVGEDFIVGRTKTNPTEEPYSFHHITNWRFAPYNAEEWTKP